MAIADFGSGVQSALQRMMAERMAQEEQKAQIENMQRQRELQTRGLDIQSGNLGLNERQFEAEQAEQSQKREGAIAAQAERKLFLGSVPQHLRQALEGQSQGFKVNAEDFQDPAVAQQQRIANIGAEAEARERAQAKYRPAPKPEKERVVAVDTIEGGKIVTKYLPESQVSGRTFPKPSKAMAATGKQKGDLAFYNRMSDALKTMEEVEPGLTDTDLTALHTVPQTGLLSYGRTFMSDAAKRYAQAMRQYTEARLRKESGAAIPQSEFAQDREAIARNYGDTPEGLAQRKAYRQKTAEGVAFAAGPAYEEYYGEPFAPLGQRGGGGGGGGGMVEMTAPDGGPLMVPADQVAAMEAAGAKRR